VIASALRRRIGAALCLLLALSALAFPLRAQAARESGGLVQLDFNDVELNVVIDTMARLTGRNFIYDDRVRGRVTIVSPAKITIDEAYAVFESVLQVKGFTTVKGPGRAIKIIPIREAKETNVETLRSGAPTPASDRFITRLIPLRYIDAEGITNTLRPLVSKDASMVAYAPTNTVILTDAGTNIARILDILRDIDVETYKEELSVVKLEHADAATLADQLSEIFGAEVADTGTTPGMAVARARRTMQPIPGQPPQPGGDVGAASHARIITDARTNSLVILASRKRTAEIREAITRLDVRSPGGGRIHVYYLKHADAEELATTLSALLGGQPVSNAAGGATSPAIAGNAPAAAALRASVSELAEGVTVTADAPTNSLVIQASKEGFNAVREVIEQLDIPRPQVLVEALIMEVDVSNGKDLGFSGLARIFDSGNRQFTIGSLTDTPLDSTSTTPVTPPITPGMLQNLLALSKGSSFVAGGSIEAGETLIQFLIRASASLTGTNVLSAPHILTLDNEQAEIKVGNNIPIITSRVESAAGIQTNQESNLASSVNVERLDVGITLRVTPQISEGESLRMKIFQEITGVTTTLVGTGDVDQVGPSLTNRKVENSVIVADNETVVIGGLIDEQLQTVENKVPFLGDVPVLGWLFKTTSDDVLKTNLLIFLTPHIIRGSSELTAQSIRKREEFWQSSEDSLQLSKAERKEADRLREEAEAQGQPVPDYSGDNPVRRGLLDQRERYPVAKLAELETKAREEAAAATATANAATVGDRYGILAATFGDEGAAAATLQELIDAGHDGELVAEERSGTVLYEIQLGPFETLSEAQEAADEIARQFGLAPRVTVIEGEGAETAPPTETAPPPEAPPETAPAPAPGPETAPQ
jgi:general secretion pathway protein D